MTDVILPGATLGVLGSGQLGRMFALAACQMGYRVHVYSPDSDTPAGQVADREVSAAYEDAAALREFARNVDVITFEFEIVPSSVTDCISEVTRVRPSGHVLSVAQNRIREKSTLRDAGLPVPEFTCVTSLAELESAIQSIGTPSVLKTASFGYDGKGQRIIRDASDAGDAWASLQTEEAILEEFVEFSCEISTIGARNPEGQFVSYAPFRNSHVNHILDVTESPSPLPREVQDSAAEITRHVFETLDVVGVLCVEMFVTTDLRILINELAPRPHNSGHLTIDAHVTSQFEQQVRAICGLPLGSAHQHTPAAMANLLGDLWAEGEPDWRSLCGHDKVKLHLYGKQDPRGGRKMGHLTALSDSTEAATQLALRARDALTAKQPR